MESGVPGKLDSEDVEESRDAIPSKHSTRELQGIVIKSETVETEKNQSLPIATLTIGTFQSKNATVDIRSDSLKISLLIEAGTDFELKLDSESRPKIREKGREFHFTLRPKKVQELASLLADKIPNGFEYTCSRSNRFVIGFSDELDEKVILKFKKAANFISQSNSQENSFDLGRRASKRPGSEVSSENEEKSSLPFKIPRKPSLKVGDSLAEPETFVEPNTGHLRSTKAARRPLQEITVEEEGLPENVKDVEIPMEIQSEENNNLRPKKSNLKADNKIETETFTDTVLTYPPGSDNFILLESYKWLLRGRIDNCIIDFYMRYLFYEVMSQEMRRRVHICSSDLYSLYSSQSDYPSWNSEESSQLSAVEKRYQSVVDLPCLTNVDIFKKDFIVFPCHDNNHWLLTIACFPLRKRTIASKRENQQNTLGDLRQPCILTFDSLRSDPERRTRAIKHIRSFLGAHYKRRYPDSLTFDQNAAIAHSPQCPEQEGSVDCGIYVLEFFERFFITSPIQDFRPIIDLRNWFSQDIIPNKREHIGQIIRTLKSQEEEKTRNLRSTS